MSEPVPIVDARDAAGVRGELLSRRPGYTRGWEPGEGSAGAALLAVVARYAEILLEGLRELPGRGQLAFLDRLGVGLLPAQPARAPLAFTLVPDSPVDVTLPAGSQVAAPPQPSPAPISGAPAPAQAAEEVVFATDESVMLTRARLTSLYSVDPGTDEWADHSDRQRDGFTLFGDLEPVEHALYLGHDEIFALAGAADLTLSFELGPGAAGAQRDLSFTWQYLSKDGWLPLEVVEDHTGRLTRSGLLRLRKSCGPDAREEAVIPGHTSYWVRGRVDREPVGATVMDTTAQGVIVDAPGHLRVGDLVTVDGMDSAQILGIHGTAMALSRAPDGLAQGVRLRQAQAPSALVPAAPGEPVGLPMIEAVRAQVGFTKGGLEPEAVASDGLPVDPNGTHHPFGVQPAPFATYSLASKEVFGRGGAEIGVEVTLRQPGRPRQVALSFEYYDGAAWQALSGRYALRDDTDRFTRDGAIVFRCPLDWRPVAVNGESNLWLRVRLDAGDYGQPERLTVDPKDPTKVVLTPSTLDPPVVAQVRLRYRYQTGLVPIDHALAFSDFHHTDHTEDAIWPGRTFEPFRPLADAQPAVHLGFDRPLPTGLVSLFTATQEADAVAEAEGAAEDASGFVWEYVSPCGWSGLGVLDETLGFRRSGTIRFVGPRDAVPVEGHGGSLYRVRARLKQGARPEPAALAGIWANTIWGWHRRSFDQEILGVSDGGPHQGFRFQSQRVPVLEGERIEVREWAGQGESWRTAVLGIPTEDRVIERDPVTDAPLAVWVRYAARPHLYRSGPGDRHYNIERATGLVRFGDGRHGLIPPAGSPIRAAYDTGAGTGGNLPANRITELRAAVPYVIGVTNVAAAAGGAATEERERVLRRGAQRLRHRDRGISADDVAWLAREASPAVLKARCLAVTGPDGPRQRGWMTVLVVPDGDEAQPIPSRELLRRVQRHLAACVPAPVAARVRVVGPRYAPVSVAAEVVPMRASEAAEVEARLLQALARFLHPLRGGPEGQGWEFGQPLYQSQIAKLVDRISGLDHVSQLVLHVAGELVDEVASVAPDALLAPGDHEIKVVLGGDR